MATSSISKLVVLTLDTGIVHEDYEETGECLRTKGVIRRTCNIYNGEQLSTTIAAVKRNSIDVIETRHIRKWQQNWTRVRPLFEQVEEAARTTGVPMIPTPSMFRWNSDKAGYLKEMADRGVAITPTTFLEYGQPYSLADEAARLPHGLVIKPSVGARAHGLHFVRKLADVDAYEIATPKESEGDEPPKIERAIVDKVRLEQFFERYRDSFRKQVVLAQEFVSDKIEYSGVMICGVEPYYIRRLEGESTNIGHDAFGGLNVLETAPSASLVSFVERVRKAMPAALRDEPIVRVDALICPDREPMLLEIESGGPRLFNENGLGNTADAYSNMLTVIARSSRTLLEKSGSRKALVNENLAPRAQVLRQLFRVSHLVADGSGAAAPLSA